MIKSYVLNNPLAYAAPLGLDACLIFLDNGDGLVIDTTEEECGLAGRVFSPGVLGPTTLHSGSDDPLPPDDSGGSGFGFAGGGNSSSNRCPPPFLCSDDSGGGTKVRATPKLTFKPPSWHNFTHDFLPCYGTQVIANLFTGDDLVGTVAAVALTAKSPLIGGPVLVDWTGINAFKAGAACAITSRAVCQ
jgi:hypothetical protein